MGLTQCPDCGSEISTAAGACPKCGRPMKMNYATPAKTIREPVVVKPTFWRDPNVGALALLAIAVVIAVGFWIHYATSRP